jgi:hypothetical protein
MALWPSRAVLLFEIREAIRFYSPAGTKGGQVSEKQQFLILPSFTLDQERTKEEKRAELRIRVPVVLDFPVAVVQTPYILALPNKREWVPKGMFTEMWRALSWPFVGLIFWWLAGRGIEALRATQRSVVNPRLGWIETVFAGILVTIGIATLIGIVTSTPDDRKDIQFMALIVGGLLWGILASFTVVARFQQWRILKRTATTETTSQIPTL